MNSGGRAEYLLYRSDTACSQNPFVRCRAVVTDCRHGTPYVQGLSPETHDQGRSRGGGGGGGGVCRPPQETYWKGPKIRG
jgi:hypothetical protein